MTRWIEQAMDSLGYPGIALLMFLENIFPPIPSELIMPLAGFATIGGELSFFGVVAAGTLGSVAGALPLYYLGKIVGQERLIAWTDHSDRREGVEPRSDQIDQPRFDAMHVCRVLLETRDFEW